MRCSSSGNAIRYLSLYDNSWLRVFNGHTDKVSARIVFSIYKYYGFHSSPFVTSKVVGVVMSPVDDCFLTGSADRLGRLFCHQCSVETMFWIMISLSVICKEQ